MKKLKNMLALGAAMAGGISLSHATVISEIEANDTLSTAQNVNGGFSTDAFAQGVGDLFNEPAGSPWVSIRAERNVGLYDYYSFSTTSAGTISLDTDFNQFDTEVALWLDNGNGTFSLQGQNDDNFGDPGSSNFPSGIQFNLPAGNYVAGVAAFNSLANDTGWTGNAVGSVYTLQIVATAQGAPVPETGSSLLLLALSGGGVMLARLRRKA